MEQKNHNHEKSPLYFLRLSRWAIIDGVAGINGWIERTDSTASFARDPLSFAHDPKSVLLAQMSSFPSFGVGHIYGIVGQGHRV